MKISFVLTALIVAMSSDALACSDPPPPVVTLEVNKFYKDKLSSVIDPDMKAKHDAAVRPLEQFMNETANLSDQFLSDPTKNRDQGACAVNWIFAWAKGGSLLGEMKTEQAFYERKWMLAGLSLVYAKVQTLATSEQRTQIEKWLSRLADLTIEHSDAGKTLRNNHYYWEGLAIGAVGKIEKNQKYLNWAQKAFEAGMEDIDSDGSLPREIKRGQRALHYHLFSAAPLAMLASILNQQSPKLKLLVDFIVQSTKDPVKITKMAGITQDKENDRDYAWLEVYLRKNPNPEIDDLLKPKRPLKYSKLGGNLSQANPLESTDHE